MAKLFTGTYTFSSRWAHITQTKNCSGTRGRCFNHISVQIPVKLLTTPAKKDTGRANQAIDSKFSALPHPLVAPHSPSDPAALDSNFPHSPRLSHAIFPPAPTLVPARSTKLNSGGTKYSNMSSMMVRCCSPSVAGSVAIHEVRCGRQPSVLGSR